MPLNTSSYPTMAFASQLLSSVISAVILFPRFAYNSQSIQCAIKHDAAMKIIIRSVKP